MTLTPGRAALCITAGCLAVFGVTLAGGFVYDDLWTIVHNPFLADPANFGRIFSGEIPPDLPDGPRRASVASALLDRQLWGLAPFGWHLQSLLWHIGCALAVAALARRVSGDERLALAAGLVFGVHGIHTEAVAAVNYREDLIVTTAVVLALVLVLRARARRRSREVWIACAVLFVGANAKETAILFPAFLLLHDLCFERGGWRAVASRHGWAYAPLTVVCFLSPFWLGILSGAAPLEHTAGAKALPPGAWLLTESHITAAYLGQLLLPVGLSADYTTPVVRRLDALAVAGLALVLGVAGLGLWNLRRRPLPAFGLLWLLVALLPTANIVPIENLRADRYLYLPSVGFCLAGAWALVSLALWIQGWIQGRPDLARWLPGGGFAALLTLVCLVYGGLALEHARVWRDDVSLWESTLSRHPGSVRARLGLMSEYQRRGRTEEALALGIETVALAPRSWKARMSLGQSYNQLGQPRRALEELRLAQQLGGDGQAPLAAALAAAHFNSGDPAAAIAVLEAGVVQHPSDAELALQLGKLYLGAGRTEAGVEMLEVVARLRTRDPQPHRVLARAYLRLGRLEDARREIGLALARAPDDPHSHELRERIERVR